jgi:tetratricopeptide (TPR) repeat protein
MMIPLNKEWSRTIKRTLVGTSAIGGAIFGTLKIFREFSILPATSDLATGITGLVAICSISLAGGALFSLYNSVRRHISTLLSQPVPTARENAIVELLTDLFSEGRHDEVSIIGYNLSRMLWVKGHWRARISVGYLLEKSAFFIKNNEAYLHALVDMVGWSSVVLGDFATGEKYFKRASKYAEDNSAVSPVFLFYQAKAYRHLGGAAYKVNRFAEAETWLSKAEDVAQRIDNREKKLELLAGIEYGRSEIFRRQLLYDQAELHTIESMRIYRELNDELRAIKTIVQHGLIYLGRKELPQAFSEFSKAKTLAELNRRKEQLSEAYFGLGQLYLEEMRVLDGCERERRKEKAVDHLRESMKLLEELGMVAEQAQVSCELKKAIMTN